MPTSQADILPYVTKPARYTNREWNAVHKSHEGARVRVALVFPDAYEAGMSHLGLRILYHVLNEQDGCVAERAFSPWGDMEQEMRAAAWPLCSLESATPLSEFDLVGITLPYELNYTNALNVLDLAGLPLTSAERDQRHPLVIAGGVCAANPEPLADYVDAFLWGEGEDAIVELAEAAQDARSSERDSLLRHLARIEGVYVPRFYHERRDNGRFAGMTAAAHAPAAVTRRVVADLDAAPYPVRQIVPFVETVHDRLTLEIMRGCGRGCRFCQAGACYRPVRERSAQTILRLAEEGLRATGYDEVSLLGFNSPDHSEIQEIVDGLAGRYSDERVSVSLPSLRIDTFSVRLAQRLGMVRRAGLTFAPEAGTQRLRDALGKRVTEDDLFQAARAAFESGWHRIKLYFMVGLPGETAEDVEAIADLVLRLRQMGREILGNQRRGRLRIAVSVNAFTPKPHTPMQWCAQDSRESLEAKFGALRGRLKIKGVQLSYSDLAASRLEAALARGDRRIGAVVEGAWRAGCRFDAWDEHFKPQAWGEAFESAGLDPAEYANRPVPVDAALPWDHLDSGMSKDTLRRQAEMVAAAAAPSA
ncbi:MAG: TIGR03960 family B12-binding radical SAM protein [Armatimonadota bacterium]|nr:MAG: TIGR03960 family B12-binding radical SAM protein [Armatimonadota bacterium]